LPVFIPEAHHAVVKGKETTVGDSHPVSVPTEILEDVLRVGDRFPHTDDPLVPVELVFNLVIGLFNVQVSTPGGSSEVIHELATKNHGEGFLIEEVGILAWGPAFALCTEGPSGHQAVQVKVGLELLVPGV